MEQSYLRGIRRDLYAPDVTICRGPVIEGQPGPKSHYWALLRTDAGIDVRVTDGTNPWVGRVEPVLEHPTLSINRLAACFDQANRLVIAYQRSEELWIRQYSPILAQYTTRGPFVGLDPVLLYDGIAAGTDDDADVLLCYVALNRLALHVRIQRETYGAERTLEQFQEPITLDQATELPSSWQLTGQGLNFVSSPYPLATAPNSDTLASTAISPPSGGTWNGLVNSYTSQNTLAAATAVHANTGSYTEVVTQITLAPDSTANAVAVPGGGGLYLPVVVDASLAGEALANTAALASAWTGRYTLVVGSETLGNDTLANTAISPPSSGSYQ
jgi:hypothetical protein